MIQISSPTQASHSQVESVHSQIDSLEKSLVDTDEVQDKDKIGLFAKLLDSLGPKGKSAVSGSPDIESDKDLVTDFTGAIKAAEVKSKKLEPGQLVLTVTEHESGLNHLSEKSFLSANIAVSLDGAGMEPDIAIAQGEQHLEAAFFYEAAERVVNTNNGEVNQNVEDLAVRGEGEQQDLVSELQQKPVLGDVPENDELLHGERASRSNTERGNLMTLASSEREVDLFEFKGLSLSGNEGNEKESSLLSDSRDKKSRLNITVRDLRTSRASSQESVSNVSREHAFDIVNKAGGEIELRLEYDLSAGRGGDDPLEIGSAKSSRDLSQSRFLTDTLARELRGNLSTEIVRNAMLIVRDGNEGTIRLTLRPASLGDVKINLEMVENKIKGLFILESNEALRAFERELPALEKAFRDSGFSETSLSLSLAQDAWNFTAEDHQFQRELLAVSSALAALHYEAELDDVLSEADSSLSGAGPVSGLTGRVSVNLLV